jgi:spore coat-associated protein N
VKRTKKRSLSKRLLLSLAALATAGAIAGMGSFASFTSTRTATETVTTGIVTIALGTANTAANRLTVNATDVVPGDIISRAADLISTNSDPLSAVTLTTTATTSSLLNTDTTNGLKMTVQTCTVSWTENATNAPGYTYTCGGSSAYLLGTAGTPVPVITTTVGGAPLAGLNALSSASATDHLLVTLSLPAAAPNTMQSLTSTIQYSFTGTQRAATNR